MSERLYMVHPKLPGQPIRIRPGALSAYRRAGWRQADEPEPEPAEAEQPVPRARRRRATAEPPEAESASDT